MGDNEKRDTDGDGETSAADEPTAIWDFEALRAAGLDAILHRPESDAPRRPTTPPGNAEPSMMVESDVLDASGESGRATPIDLKADLKTDAKASDPAAVIESIAPVEMRPGFEGAPTRRYGWGAALAAGAVFFGAVYALIRFLL